MTKGQVTVFIILGMVILVVAGSIMLLVGNSKELEPSSFNVQPIQIFVEKCLETTTEEGIYHIGMQGGFNEVILPYEEFPTFSVPYYFSKGQESFPTLETLETELANYIQTEIQNCNLTTFQEQGFTIFTDMVSARTAISATNIFTRVTFPLTITKGDQTTMLETFTQNVQVPLGHLYAESRTVIEENDEGIPLGLMSDLAFENNFLYTSVSIGNKVLYSLFSNESEPYQYNFMIDYDWPEINDSLPWEELTVVGVPPPEEDFEDTTIIDVPLEELLLSSLNFFRIDFFPSVVADAHNTQDTGALSNQDLYQSVVDNPALLDNPAVFDQFETRMNQPDFVNKINANRELLNNWASRKGISFGTGGQLDSFDGTNVITKGTGSTTFNPNDVQGAEVLSSGALQFPSGAIASNAQVTKEGSQIVLTGGQVDVTASKTIKNTRVREGSIISGDREALPGQDVVFNVDKKGNPTIQGDVTVLNGGVEEVSFKGKATFEKKGILFGDGTTFNDYVNGPSTQYQVEKATWYMNTLNACRIDNCIEKDFASGSFQIRVKNNNLIISSFDDSIKIFKVKEINDNSRVIFNDKDKLRMAFSKKPMVAYGNLAMLDIEIENQYRSSGRIKTFRLTPSPDGAVASVCTTRCQDVGVVSERSLLFMNSMAEGTSSQNKRAKELGKLYGGRDSLRIQKFLDDPGELRVINAILKAADQTGLDPTFLAGISFVEGLGYGWMKKYYQNPEADVSAFTHIGADRFGKEVNTLKKQGVLREDFSRQDYFITGNVENEAGEVVPNVEFHSIEPAMEGLAAMVKQRQSIFKEDLRMNGVNPEDLTKDEINFWTYVYYNGGSGPPEDPKGRGRSIVRIRSKGGPERFAIPTAPRSPGNQLGNAQRVMATSKLLEESNPPQSSKLALKSIKKEGDDTG